MLLRIHLQLIIAIVIMLGSSSLQATDTSSLLQGKKVLWIDSYHKGYVWSDGIEKGIKNILHKSGVDLEIFRMDTKRNNSTAFCQKAGLDGLQVVKKYKPDVVIATDDNAQKFLVVPFLKDTDMPVVFSGVNWDASMYGYPNKNITGMLEIDLVEELVKHFKHTAKGDRIGYLSADVETDRKISKFMNERFFNQEMNVYLVKTFDDFKRNFLRAQKEVDMLIIYNSNGIAGWDESRAENFLFENTTIPTGTLLQFMDRFVTYTLGKYPEEQGEYAAETALKILTGTKPSSIPLAVNKRAKLTLNLKMAQAAGIVLPVSIMKIGNVIGQEIYEEGGAVARKVRGNYAGKKILWVDSYHRGYEWSDGIKKGIEEVLVESGTILQTVTMDTKRNDSVQFGKNAGVAVKAIVDKFQPDVVIATDDNAQKYLVVPFLKESAIPVVFSGVNWDASMYGYPTKNITGMVEVEMIEETIRHLRQYSQGDKVGYLCGDVETGRKVGSIYNRLFFGGKLRPYYVTSMEGFKREFKRAKKEVDMLIIMNHAGIADWDGKDAEKFLLDEASIPTGSFFDYMSKFVIFTLAKYPEEQGSYAARTALRILAGTIPSDIPLVTNSRNKMTINLKMADAAGIVIPVQTLKDADIIIGQEAVIN